MRGDERATATRHLLPFWRRKALHEMSDEEWEALCDHCGQCCLVKLEDEDSGAILLTSVVCRLYDTARGGCMCYAQRQRLMPDCVRLTPENVRAIAWLPETCAYRLVARGEELPEWHPLRSGTRETVARAGVAIAASAVSEAAVAEEDLPRFIVRKVCDGEK